MFFATDNPAPERGNTGSGLLAERVDSFSVREVDTLPCGQENDQLLHALAELVKNDENVGPAINEQSAQTLNALGGKI